MKYFTLACMIFIISFSITAILMGCLYMFKRRKQKRNINKKTGNGN